LIIAETAIYSTEFRPDRFGRAAIALVKMTKTRA